MYRSVRFLSLALILLVAMSFVAMGQAQFKLPIYITCSGSTMGGKVDTMYMGVGPTNTYGPDVAVVGTYKESQAAPPPPAYFFYSTWQQIPGRTLPPPDGIAASGLRPSDFRGYRDALQVDTMVLYVKIGPAPSTSGIITLTIPANLTAYCNSIEMLKADADGNYQPFDPNIMLPVGRTTVVDPNAARSKDLFYLLIRTGAKQPPPGPFCIPAPTSLALGNVSANITVNNITLTNTGDTNPLTITGVTAPTGFTTSLSSTTLAQQGGTATLTVTFDATALAPATYSGNIVIASNAVGGDVLIPVSATVVAPGIVLTPSSLAFGVVPYPQVRTRTVVVANASPLREVTGIALSTLTGYSVAPALTSLAAGASATLTVTFTTLVTGGDQIGNIVISSSNAPSASLAITGTSQVQGGKVAFATVLDTVLDNSFNGTDDGNGGSATPGYYTGVIGLHEYSGQPLHGLQFTLKSNGLVVMYLGKLQVNLGAKVAGWTLAYQVYRGAPLADGSSMDSVCFALFAPGNSTLDTSGISAAPLPLLSFGYDVVNINENYLPTSFTMSTIFGTTNGFLDAGLNASALQDIVVKNRINRGDVNNDDRVDILDLLMIVDHITGKARLTPGSDSFIAADVAPWPNGDGLVDVRDLAQLQNIILQSAYPNGDPLLQIAPASLAGLPKAGTIAKIYYSNKEIGIVIDGPGGFRGLSVEFTNVKDVVGLESDDNVGQAYRLNGSRLNVVVKTAAEAEAGAKTVVRIPCTIQQATVGYENLQVVGADLRMMGVEVEIIYNQLAPENGTRPSDFNLAQNFPNPFNPTTKINFAVKELSQVRIAIYNILGQEVAVLVNGELAAGRYSKEWNGMDSNGKALSTGTYIYRMTAGNFVETKKMMFVK